MTLWGRVALAMVLLVVVTLGAILSADYFTGGGIGLKPLAGGRRGRLDGRAAFRELD